MRETELVEVIRRLAQSQPIQRNLLKGIGDDCAILRPRAGEDLVFTSDLLLEGRHFLLETHRAADVGHKALARSLSDLAAMGSEPVFCLVSLGIPAECAGRWIKSFYRGLLGIAARYKTVLAGGDLSRFERIVVDVTCCGRVPSGQALLRSGARPGDLLYVTGVLGASAQGLSSRRGRNWKRHLRPEPRIAEGIALRKRGATAAMDLSDGLSLDLQRLCRESNVSARIESARIPVAPRATLEEALHGGEDYELLFTAPPGLRMPIGTKVGAICEPARRPVFMDGRPLEPGGFDHFS